MAKLLNTQLSNFRNFKENNFSFENKTNIFFGNNGSGKTNILESISLISKGRGIRKASYQNLIKKNEKNFSIKTLLDIKNNDYEIDIYLENKENKYNKITKVNQDSSKDSLSFINSSLSFLVFLPEMERLFLSNPSFRRNFIDRLIFSEKNDYNKLINKYKKYIIERTKILQQNNYDSIWISQIEKEISNIGLKIYDLRNEKLNILNTHIKELNMKNNYNFDINLKMIDSFFNPNLNLDTYILKLQQSRNLDKKTGGSIIGPHKSDIIATINRDFEASQLSTGQQKTLVLMILLAQCDYLVKFIKIKPIFLFDEICSHLDSFNRKILLDLINNFDVQFFLTGTSKSLFSFISTNVNFYNITKI